MLIAEYDYETDIAVQRAEEREIAFAQGISQGISQGRSEGLVQGRSEGIAQGSYQTKIETAKILKQFGDSVQKIAQATGLTQAEVEAIN